MLAEDQINEAKKVFEVQKSAYSPSSAPSLAERLDRVNRIDQLCRNNIESLTETLSADFGCRSPDWTFNADFYSPLDHSKHIRKNLKKWMKPTHVSSGLLALTGQRTYIVNEPLGVVGIMSPFNAPVSLALDPALDAIGAGNSVMIKMSENTPETANLFQSLVAEYFDEKEVAVVTGEQEVSKAFAALPWDKFFFTGGSEVGKRILAANAENLTPVILELGGKSPCVILEDSDVAAAATRIGRVKQVNAGQVCLTGDYALVPESQLETFIDTVVQKSESTYPHILENPEFTSIVNDDAFDRIVSYIDEARDAGCRVVQVNPKAEALPDKATRKIPLTIVVDPGPELMVSKREIFGPILIVWSYKTIDEVITHINRGEKPLALYIFGKNRAQIDTIINSTSSGGVTVNDVMMHANSDKMGFGGVGYSGTGRYKGGFVGFSAFSNPKAVFEQGLMGRFAGMFFPPFKDDRSRRFLRRQVGM